MSRRSTSTNIRQQFGERQACTFFIQSLIVSVTKYCSCSWLHNVWHLLENLHKSVLDIPKDFAAENVHIKRDFVRNIMANYCNSFLFFEIHYFLTINFTHALGPFLKWCLFFFTEIRSSTSFANLDGSVISFTV